MNDQGKANYEGFHAAIPGSSPVPFDELPHIERLRWDAGATSVELWLAEAPVDEDMPGNEPDEANGTERTEDALRRIAGEAVALRAELDRVKTDAQVKLDAHRDEIGKLRKLLVRAVRELADSGSPGQNRLAAELARDGGIEL